MLCGNTLHRLIMPATHVFCVARAGTALNLGGTESGLSFGYHGIRPHRGRILFSGQRK